MFKEYKYIKLLLGSVFLILILLEWNKGIQNSANLFTDQISYSSNDEIKIIAENPVPIDIKNLSGHTVYEGTSEDALKSLPGGLYTINDKFPLVVKSEERKEFTIVFPYVNNMLFNNNGDGPLIDLPQDTLTMNSVSYIDQLDRNLFGLMNEMNLQYNVVADFDLEKDSLWRGSSCVIVYGKSKFYSEEMSANLLDYMNSGGNVLMFTSSFAFYKIEIDADKRNIIKVRNESKDFVRVRDKIPVHEAYGGVATSNKLTFNTGHTSNVINLTTSLWSNFAQMEDKFKFTPVASLPINGTIKMKTEIGEISSINSSSGITYLIGSEDVLLNVNMQNKEWRNYLKEVLVYLIEK